MMASKFTVEKVSGAKYIIRHDVFPQQVPSSYELQDYEQFIDFPEYVEAINNQPSVEETREIIERVVEEENKDAALRAQLANTFSAEELTQLKQLLEGQA
jgi:hypothetical protein